jgi:hypothetical protein
VTDSDTPPVNALVDLQVDGDDTWAASRVEDVGGAALAVAAPPVPARPGAAVRVFWKADGGPWEISTVVDAIVSDPLPTWHLRVTGERRKSTRRAFFRVQVDAPVQLRREDGAAPATLIDLSEGGLRCHVRADPIGLEVAGEVDVAVELPERTVVLAAEVVRRRAHDLGTEVSFRFLDVAEADGDVIRRHLFAVQRRLRARGLL